MDLRRTIQRYVKEHRVHSSKPFYLLAADHREIAHYTVRDIQLLKVRQYIAEITAHERLAAGNFDPRHPAAEIIVKLVDYAYILFIG